MKGPRLSDERQPPAGGASDWQDGHSNRCSIDAHQCSPIAACDGDYLCMAWPCTCQFRLGSCSWRPWLLDSIGWASHQQRHTVTMAARSGASTEDGAIGDNEDENQPLIQRGAAEGGHAAAPTQQAETEDEVLSTGPLVAAMVATVALVPLPGVLSAAYGVPVAAAKTLAVTLLMAAFWSLEPLPLAATALLPIVLLPVLGVLPASHVAVQYMNNSNLLFLGSLFVAAAVEQAGLHYRLALAVLRLVGTQPHKLLLGFMTAW